VDDGLLSYPIDAKVQQFESFRLYLQDLNQTRVKVELSFRLLCYDNAVLKVSERSQDSGSIFIHKNLLLGKMYKGARNS